MHLPTTSTYWQQRNVERRAIHGWLLRDALQCKEVFVHQFQNHASIFCNSMLITINVGGHGQWYILLIIMCATTNIDFPMEDRYSNFIWQHSPANILNVSQSFIKLPHQTTKLHWFFAQFSKISNKKKKPMIQSMLLFAN